jgi:hypothetical protein
MNSLIGTKRVWVVWLLFFSCIAAAVLLLKMETPPRTQLTSTAQLDSLITLTLDEHNISQNRIRSRTVEIDSVFSRNLYTVRVPPDFSKTSFHYSLHHNLQPYRVQTIGHVQFPEQNLRIHLLVNDKVHRSVFLNSD